MKKKIPNDATRARMDRFFSYYKDAPIQKYAAAYAGVNENTITNWKNEYPDFLDRLLEMESEFVKEELKKVRTFDSKWVLERLFKKTFAERKELTDGEGESLFSKYTDEQLDAIISSKIGKTGDTSNS